jgi:UDP-glucose 4-epimerase
MRILITGGAGYIGAHTGIELLTGGYEIAVLDNFSNSKPEAVNRIRELSGKDFPFYECDLLDRDALDRVFAEQKPDAVIHFAGLKAVGESVGMPLAYYHNNITGTLYLCEAMKKHGVKNLVFSSSATVYGTRNRPPLTEDMQTGGCTNPYGQTKFMIEEILKDLHASDNTWNITLLRYFNVAGAHGSGRIGDDPQGIPNNIMPILTQVAVGKLPVLRITGLDYETPDGTCQRDYIHVIDLALGHIKALEGQKGRKGLNIYNLGTGKGISVLELVAAFERASGITLHKENAPRRPGDLPFSFASSEKAERELGFKARYDINRMCEDSWRWQSMNPEGL